MKTARKILALSLVLMLCMALAIPALAATGGTITVTGTTGTVYTVYKMFDVEVAVGDSGNKYKVTTEWADFAAEPGVSTYFTVVNGYVMWQKSTTSAADAAAIAQLARAYAEKKSLTSTQTVTTGSGALALAEDGYYLLVPDNDSASGVQVIAGGKDVTITEKTVAPGMPTVEKKVTEDSTGLYGANNTVEIGQTIEFRTTITAGEGASKYVLHDKMDEHILFQGLTQITRDGNLVPTTEYTLVTDGLTDGCTFHIEFHESLCSSLADDATLVVDYTGVLPQGVQTDTDHENLTWMTYTEQNVKTNESSTATRTFKIEAKKVDQDGNPLGGAGFVLRDNIGKYYKWDDVAKVVVWVDTMEEASEVFSDETTGEFTFFGVDAENFFLVEKTVPGGYTGIAETSVSTKSGDVLLATTPIEITNTLGTALPETGGMGTTLFYILGATLVVFAVVALTVIRRKGCME